MKTDTTSEVPKRAGWGHMICDELQENISLYMTALMIILIQYFIDQLASFVSMHCK